MKKLIVLFGLLSIVVASKAQNSFQATKISFGTADTATVNNVLLAKFPFTCNVIDTDMNWLTRKHVQSLYAPQSGNIYVTFPITPYTIPIMDDSVQAWVDRTYKK